MGGTGTEWRGVFKEALRGGALSWGLRDGRGGLREARAGFRAGFKGGKAGVMGIIGGPLKPPKCGLTVIQSLYL